MYKIGIIGATGYTGVELLRLLATHTEVEVYAIASRGEVGKLVSEVFPSLRGVYKQKFVMPDDESLFACDVLFFATPNGIAMQDAPKFLARGIKVIDLAADFRLSASEFEQWYGMEHQALSWLDQAVYGLTEWNRDLIKNAKIVANPGCYPTAVQLALMPLMKSNCLSHSAIIANCISGVSGAGRKADLGSLFAEMGESFKAYGVSLHRHTPEIERGLSLMQGAEVDFTFVPHLCPMTRGIHATIYFETNDNIDVQQVLADFYQDEAFVDVMPQGSLPETRSVKGSNYCRISAHALKRKNRWVITAVIDNLVKGAAGQAIQNMNVMLGLPESLGLKLLPLSP